MPVRSPKLVQVWAGGLLERGRRAVAVVRQVIGFDELVLGAGLALVGYGFWDFWRPGAFLIPGFVLVFIALSERKPFIERRPLPPAKRRV